MALLDIRNLTIELSTSQGWMSVVERVNLKLNEGELRGLVGESGSGKSLIAKAILGSTNDTWRMKADRFFFNGIDLLKLSEKKRQKLISEEISMIYQEPKSCLDPSMRIGKQIKLTIPNWTFKGKFWERLFWKKRRTIELLHKVGIKDHKEIMHAYPSEITEGECQKVMIAIALATQPKLLIADEPTNAMESTTEAQIFRLLTGLNKNSGMTILLISHDLQMLSKWSENINVIYCGQIVEMAESQDLITSPFHPYTQALIASTPDFGEPIPPKSLLPTLPGFIPPLEHLPVGCRLGPRCPYAQRKCIESPELKESKGRFVACHFPINQTHTEA